MVLNLPFQLLSASNDDREVVICQFTLALPEILAQPFPHGLSLRREHNGSIVRLDRQWLATVRYLLVVLAAVQARKKLSELTLKIRTRPITSGILSQNLLDLSYSP